MSRSNIYGYSGQYKNRELDISKVESENNLSDILTKSVNAEVFNRQLSSLGFSFGTKASGASATRTSGI